MTALRFALGSRHAAEWMGNAMDLRLAGTVHSGALKPENLERALGPEVRLALAPEQGADVKVARMESAMPKSTPPDVRLAHIVGAQGDNSLAGQRGVERIPESSAPALLVSYAYLESFERERHRFIFRDWALDSGAFTAHTAGTVVDLAAYVDTCLRLREQDPQLAEVFALDVIGDWEASARNAEEMKRQGVDAVPCYHYGEPEEALLEIARSYDKIALGGVARMRERKRTAWVAQCFARVWPKKVHGFGMATRGLVLGFPFHSVDATSWELGPCGFGNWRSFGKMSVRGSNQNLRAEVEWYLALEREARSRWRREMEMVESHQDGPRLSVRLATKIETGRADRAFGKVEP